MNKNKKYEDWTKEELVNEIEKLKKRKKYGLVWEEKKENVAEQCKKELPILKDDKKLEVTTNNSGQYNLLIEGDNYHALSVLNYTHKNKVDIIYIDPPYNTGKRKEWKFNDNWVDENDAYRHSKWVSFMEKRLKLARNLLKETGIIFISIDDNELAQLKLILDDVFTNNHIATFIHKNNSIKNQANLVGISTEYMLLYSKKKDGLKGKKWRIPKKGAGDIARLHKKLLSEGLSLDEILEEVKSLYMRPKYSHLSRWNKVDKNGVFKDSDLSREDGPKDYTIINPNTKKSCVIPKRGWGKTYKELIRLQKANLIWYGDDSTPPGMKHYITEGQEVIPDSFLYFDNSVDTRLIKDMFGELVFENPKPMEMIKTIIKMSKPSNALILDFFAGSGTTGHAVLDLNKEDDGCRKFILCTNNENNIAKEVCYPRIKKAIKGYISLNKKKIKGLGGNLKYFTTNFVNSASTDSNKIRLTQKATEMLCMKEETYKLVDSKKDYKIFKNKNKFTGIIYDQLSIPKFKNKIEKLEGQFSVYIFSLGDDTFEEEFLDMRDKVTLSPIPESILKVYRRIFK